MADLDLVIRGGTVVNADSIFKADVGISGEKVVELGYSLRGRRIIDAQDRYVMPGGVDVHVHLSPARNDRAADHVWLDDFTSGSRAAIAGGITTIGNMTFQWQGESLTEALARDERSAQSQALIDYILHPVITNPDQRTRAALAKLPQEGVATVKVFLSNATFDARIDEYLAAMQVAADHDMLVLAHCEDGPLLRHLATRLEQHGSTGTEWWEASRPDYVEAAAISRAAALARATGAEIYAVHVSSAAALEACRQAKQAGASFYVEARPMYLHLTKESFRAPDGAKYVGAPPLRDAGDVDALWTALRDGTVDTVATDHAPWSLEAKLDRTLTFRTARQGVADLDTSLPLLFSEGVVGGRISLTRFVQLVSTRPAQLFGLWPDKGAIAPGFDADLVIWDPAERYVTTAAEMHSRADYSVYEGLEAVGRPMTTISRGAVVMEDRQITATPGRGRRLMAARNTSR